MVNGATKDNETIEEHHKINPNDIQMLLDIPFKITAFLGHTQVSVKDMLELDTQSIITLDSQSGDPVSIYIGNKLIAWGEVVVINEKFGVRILKIVSPEDRLKLMSG